MLKQLERPEAQKPTESLPAPQTDTALQAKAAEARALLKRIEERKQRDAEELERRRTEELTVISRKMRDGVPKGGYCGCW